MTVAEVGGVTFTGSKSRVIDARARHIGVKLPADEVMAGTKRPGGRDALGEFSATRTYTSQSRVFVELKLYMLECAVSATRP
jgi:hypothetical protein